MSTQDISACRASQDEGVSVYHRMSFIACKYFRNGHDNILGTHINKLFYITHTSTGPLSVCTLQVVLYCVKRSGSYFIKSCKVSRLNKIPIFIRKVIVILRL